jgi:ABC-type phosphate transport system substrate-binding protein
VNPVRFGRKLVQSALLVSALLGAQSAAAQDFQVIINSANPVQFVTKDQVAKVFMKKIKKWDSGLAVVPVDQTGTSPARVAFTKSIHGKAVNAVVSAWQQEIFAGREIPPAEKAGDAAVIAFVKGNPGAIGYVSSLPSTEGVRAVEVR